MILTKRSLSALLAACLLAAPSIRLTAQPADAPASNPVAPQSGITAEFSEIFNQISEKLKAGETSEEALAPEVKAIDALLARYSAEKNDEVAMVALMKARLYLEVFENTDEGLVQLRAIKTNFPESQIAQKIDQAIAAIEKQAASANLLAVGKMFPAFEEKDLAGQPLSLANYKGKIVLVDFWATWCGPCVQELPNVIAAYDKYHDKGFEIIGISLDQDRGALDTFIKEKNLKWPQYFDGLGWKNKLGQEMGINSIPATFLVDGNGVIIAKNLRGDGLDKKLATLIK